MFPDLPLSAKAVLGPPIPDESILERLFVDGVVVGTSCLQLTRVVFLHTRQVSPDVNGILRTQYTLWPRGFCLSDPVTSHFLAS